MQIRPLRADDRAAWQPLWDAYLHFYRAVVDAATTDSTFTRLAAEQDGMYGLVAETDGLIGFAHVVTHPSTWSTGPSTYLEDLFVAPEGRGSGTARALIAAVYARAGDGDVYWHTQEYNAPARSLYDAVGRRTSFIVYER